MTINRERLYYIICLLFIVVLFLFPRPAQSQAIYRTSNPKGVLNDTLYSPGGILTRDTSLICQRGYSSSIRSVDMLTKHKVFQEYQITPDKDHKFEVDHIVSLELGGSNDIKNLWPQPYFGLYNAYEKDKLEDRLKSLVCRGQLDIVKAQAMVSKDWIFYFDSMKIKLKSK